MGNIASLLKAIDGEGEKLSGDILSLPKKNNSIRKSHLGYQHPQEQIISAHIITGK